MMPTNRLFGLAKGAYGHFEEGSIKVRNLSILEIVLLTVVCSLILASPHGQYHCYKETLQVMQYVKSSN